MNVGKPLQQMDPAQEELEACTAKNHGDTDQHTPARRCILHPPDSRPRKFKDLEQRPSFKCTTMNTSMPTKPSSSSYHPLNKTLPDDLLSLMSLSPLSTQVSNATPMICFILYKVYAQNRVPTHCSKEFMYEKARLFKQ